jgi:cysteine desulfurase
MRIKEVYLDSGASTIVDPKVLKAMEPYFGKVYGNASSLHRFGQQAKEALEKSRSTIVKSIGAKTDEVVFTSGGTESNNFTLKGIAWANKSRGNHIITTKIEHPCILESAKWLETQGFKVTYLGVDKEGFVNLKELEKAITKKTLLVSIIHGNNETGTIQDLEAIGKICKKHKIYFHTDACQSYTKVDIDVKKMKLDLVTLNSHKIHGPKGVGALYIKSGTKITPLMHGGGHEFNERSGTENISGIVGFAEAVRVANKKHVKHIKLLRDKLIKGVLTIPSVKLNGPEGDKRLCNNANFLFKGVNADVLGNYLNVKSIASSAGSACSAGQEKGSHVLKALGLSNQDAVSSIRLSLSRFNTREEIDYVLQTLPGLVRKLRKGSWIEKVVNKIILRE